MASPDCELAFQPGQQRPDRGRQQFDQTRQAGGVWVHPIRALPDTSVALRRTPRLDTPSHHHPKTPLKSEEPHYHGS